MKLKSITMAVIVALTVTMAGVGAASTYDLGGQTIRFQTGMAGDTPLGLRGEFNWYDPDPRLQAHIESVEEMFNVNIEFVHPGGWTNARDVVRQGVLSGDQPIHMFHVAAGMTQLAEAGLLLPLNDVLEPGFYDSYPESWRHDWSTIYSYGPYVYGFESKLNQIAIAGVIWNKDLFEAEGLPNLYDLYEAGEWTWDAMLEVASAATQDTTGDGVLDRPGLNLAGSGDLYLPTFLFASNNVQWSTPTEDGSVSFDLTSPEMLEMFDFIERLLAAQVTGPASSVLDENFVMQMWGIHITSSDVTQQSIRDHGLNVGVVPIPKGPSAIRYPARHDGAWMGVIPIYVENPREVIEVARALWKVSAPYIDPEEYERTYWERNSMYFSDRESLEVWQWLIRNAEVPRTFFEQHILEQAGLNDAIHRVIREGHSAATELGQITPVANEIAAGLLD